MAKTEYRLHGGFDEILSVIHDTVMGRSITASFEDGSDASFGDIKCSVRVYERYSALGGNRVSMNITAAGRDGDVFVSVITSGGSQGMFLKLNTFGESSFLSTLDGALERFM